MSKNFMWIWPPKYNSVLPGSMNLMDASFQFQLFRLLGFRSRWRCDKNAICEPTAVHSVSQAWLTREYRGHTIPQSPIGYTSGRGTGVKSPLFHFRKNRKTKRHVSEVTPTRPWDWFRARLFRTRWETTTNWTRAVWKLWLKKMNVESGPIRENKICRIKVWSNRYGNVIR